jgi:hypothetical protein
MHGGNGLVEDQMPVGIDVDAIAENPGLTVISDREAFMRGRTPPPFL